MFAKGFGRLSKGKARAPALNLKHWQRRQLAKTQQYIFLGITKVAPMPSLLHDHLPRDDLKEATAVLWGGNEAALGKRSGAGCVCFWDSPRGALPRFCHRVRLAGAEMGGGTGDKPGLAWGSAKFCACWSNRWEGAARAQSRAWCWHKGCPAAPQPHERLEIKPWRWRGSRGKSCIQRRGDNISSPRGSVGSRQCSLFEIWGFADRQTPQPSKGQSKYQTDKQHLLCKHNSDLWRSVFSFLCMIKWNVCFFRGRQLKNLK